MVGWVHTYSVNMWWAMNTSRTDKVTSCVLPQGHLRLLNNYAGHISRWVRSYQGKCTCL